MAEQTFWFHLLPIVSKLTVQIYSRLTTERSKPAVRFARRKASVPEGSTSNTPEEDTRIAPLSVYSLRQIFIVELSICQTARMPMVAGCGGIVSEFAAFHSICRHATRSCRALNAYGKLNRVGWRHGNAALQRRSDRRFRTNVAGGGLITPSGLTSLLLYICIYACRWYSQPASAVRQLPPVRRGAPPTDRRPTRASTTAPVALGL